MVPNALGGLSKRAEQPAGWDNPRYLAGEPSRLCARKS